MAGCAGVVVETHSVHEKRGVRLAAEFGVEASGGLGHEPQRERGNVAWCAGAPGGCLDRGGELVEGEVVGAADLEYAAAGRGVGPDSTGRSLMAFSAAADRPYGRVRAGAWWRAGSAAEGVEQLLQGAAGAGEAGRPDDL